MERGEERERFKMAKDPSLLISRNITEP